MNSLWDFWLIWKWIAAFQTHGYTITVGLTQNFTFNLRSQQHTNISMWHAWELPTQQQQLLQTLSSMDADIHWQLFTVGDRARRHHVLWTWLPHSGDSHERQKQNKSPVLCKQATWKAFKTFPVLAILAKGLLSHLIFQQPVSSRIRWTKE